MKRYFLVWALLMAMAACGKNGQAQSCPDHIYLENTAIGKWDGKSEMKSNGGLITFYLDSSTATGSGTTCTYKRPVDPNYAVFIGRNLESDEAGAAPAGNGSWSVELKNGGATTVTCPYTLEIGPVAMYDPADGSTMTPIPDNWNVTKNNIQSLSFNTSSSELPFTLRCNYMEYRDVELYIPPPPRDYSAAACAGLYTAGASLSDRLAACPGLDDLILWEDGSGKIFSHSGYSYPAWTAAQTARLDQLFQMMQSGQADLGLDCPNPEDNVWTAGQYNSSPGHPVRSELLTQLFFTADQAFDTYAAQVAWSLYLEVNHRVPWSVLSHPASELAELFDSRRFHTRLPARPAASTTGYTGSTDNYPSNIQEGRDFWNATSRDSAAWEAVCDPRIAYQFLSGGPNSSSQTNLLGATEVETLKNLTWWFHENVAHGDYRDAQTSAVLATPSVYLSNRLVARSDTYYTPPSQPLVIADAGCHSASNLFYDLAKGVNIPLLHMAMTQPGVYAAAPLPPIYIDFARHSGLVYGWGSPATTLILEHTDDVYAMYGLIFPVDATNHPVADPAEALFAATWLSPAQLTPWDFTLTNDFGLQNAFSTYGNPFRWEVETQGILAGYWTPGNAPTYANSDRFTWFMEGQLCSYAGTHNVMWNCENSDASGLETNWISSFGQSILQAPGGGTATTAQSYIDHLQACAMAATGLSSPSEACLRFSGGNSEYAIQWKNRHATTYWVGPVGK